MNNTTQNRLSMIPAPTRSDEKIDRSKLTEQRKIKSVVTPPQVVRNKYVIRPKFKDQTIPVCNKNNQLNLKQIHQNGQLKEST